MIIAVTNRRTHLKKKYIYIIFKLLKHMVGIF
jgi:hypothetical protein